MPTDMEKAVEAALDAYRALVGAHMLETGSVNGGLREAITAALLAADPFMGREVIVRKLEWRSEPPYSVARDTALRLTYATECVWDDGTFLYCILSGSTVNQQCDTLETAKAAAQQDYETRIRSALVMGREVPEGVDIPRLPVGTRVQKSGGYPFPGEVRAAFTTKAGNERFVVEATGEEYAGMLHIFNGGQLTATPADTRIRSALEPGDGWRPTHRHLKRGSEYMVVGEARVQAEEPIAEDEPVIVYRGKDGKLWVRHVDEFNDGRFASLPTPPSQESEG